MERGTTECRNSGEDQLVDDGLEDMTESSSSFGGTVSGTENGSILSDEEVESAPCRNSLLGWPFDGFDGPLQMRKKKLTDHWRRFIRPLIWRCKWIELRLKEFQVQALKYDRELEAHDQTEIKKVMKRKKRKRIEETTDLASYLSQHNLFSYKENKKLVATHAGVGEYCDHLDKKLINSKDDFEVEECSSLGFGDDDDSLEQHLQKLRKLEVLQSQVRQLMTRVVKVASENPGKLYSVNKLSLPVQSDAGAGYTNVGYPLETRDNMPDSFLDSSLPPIFECNMKNAFMAASAVSCHREIKEEIAVHNEVAEEELQCFEVSKIQQVERPKILMEKPKVASRVLDPGDNLPTNTYMPYVKQNVSLPPTSKSKAPSKTRKRR